MGLGTKPVLNQLQLEVAEPARPVRQRQLKKPKASYEQASPDLVFTSFLLSRLLLSLYPEGERSADKVEAG